MVYNNDTFVHLHVHSHYSMLDGSIRMKDLCQRTAELGMPAIALTDHGNMFGALDFQEQAQKFGIKPIFGCEMYLAPSGMERRDSKEKSFHLLALAENEEGYHNLCKLTSISYIEGFYYKPRIDKEVLSNHCKGLIFGSACLGGEIASLIRYGKMDQAKQAAGNYIDIVGKDNFFLEMMDHGLADQKKVNSGLVTLSREMGIPLVATNDTHFLNRDDYDAHQILLCIGTGKKLSDPDRFKFESDQLYLKSVEEMRQAFSEVPEAITNSLEIAARCNVLIETTDTAPPKEKYKIPAFDVPEGKSEIDYLRDICEEGLHKRYPEITAEVRERLEMEIGVIERMGFPGYFLIVWDMIDYAKRHDIPVGPGRGSAAGSIVAYTMGITDVDPLEYDLFFERFLNPGRISMPDIDTDFCVAKRGQVIEYLREKYGSAQVSQIITYNYMKTKAVLKDVGRVLDIDFNESNLITSLVPDELGISLEEAVNKSPELRAKRAQGGVFETLFRNAFKLENVIRHSGVHAAGVVISNRPLVDYIPLYKDNKTGNIVSQFDGPHLESAGLVKMDILGLKNLTTMAECRKLVRDNRGFEIDFDGLPIDDLATYRLLQDGRSLGVFQLESSGMQQLLKDLKPDKFTEIISLIALYRPGPLGMNMDKKFVNRKYGREKIEYSFPELEPILEDTNGIILYQEQVMLISRVIGGFSMEEADNLRKAMGKKKEAIVQKMRAKFLSGAKAGKFDQKKAENLYDHMAEFAKYGFNKSHSTAYAVISYRTAYLKANYTLEYMAALLTGDKNDQKKLSQYIREARDMGIKILPPDINFSEVDFSVENNAIRFGFSAIKGVGDAASDAIIKARDEAVYFKTLFDFCKSVDMRTVNRRTIETLISSGGFGSCQKPRSVLYAELEATMQKATHIQDDMASGQGNFFDMFSPSEDAAVESLESDLAEWPEEKLFDLERELLGAYVTGHPLQKYKKTIHRLQATPSTNATNLGDNARIRMAGLLRKIDIRLTKDGRTLAIATLEDQEGTCEVVFFQNAYEQYESLLVQGKAVFINVTVSRPRWNPARVSLRGEKVQLLQELLVQDLHICLGGKGIPEESLFKIREELIDIRHKGPSTVFFHLNTEDGQQVVVRANDNLTVEPTEGLLGFLRQHPAIEKVYLA